MDLFKTFNKWNTSIACVAMCSCSLVMSPYPRDLIVMS